MNCIGAVMQSNQIGTNTHIATITFRKKYRKFPKYSDTQKMFCNYPKSWTRWLFLRVMHPKDAEGIANSVDPDQTAPLFAQACPSENLGK